MWTEQAIARELEGRFFDIWGNDLNEEKRRDKEYRAAVRELSAKKLSDAAIQKAAKEEIERQFARNSGITPRAIIAAVAFAHMVSITDVTSSTRWKKAVVARQHAYWLMREIKGFSFPRIAALFDRDHTTVIHACRMWPKRRHLFVAQQQEVLRQLNFKPHSATTADSGVSAEPRHS